MEKYLLPDHFSQAPASYIIMIVILLFSLAGFYNTNFFGKAILHPKSIIANKEYYRLFSSDLVHVDIIHLVINGITFYIFCTDLEELLKSRSANGSFHFVSVYLVSMLTGNLLVTIKNRDNFIYSSAGASGSIMGSLFCYMLLEPFGHAVSVALFGNIWNIFIAPMYIGILVFYKLKRKSEAINHDLHFFGALGGIIAFLLLYMRII